MARNMDKAVQKEVLRQFERCPDRWYTFTDAAYHIQRNTGLEERRISKELITLVQKGLVECRHDEAVAESVRESTLYLNEITGTVRHASFSEKVLSDEMPTTATVRTYNYKLCSDA